jgi:hypothetical protein
LSAEPPSAALDVRGESRQDDRVADQAVTDSDERQREGFARVMAGVALTVVLWLVQGAPVLRWIRLAFGPPFLIAIIVALAGRRMHWSGRTARASTTVFACLSVLLSVFYIWGAHVRLIGFVVLFEALGVWATWLAWKGGLIIAQTRARPR